MYKVLIMPIVLYACRAWSYAKTDEKKVSNI